MQMDVEDLLPSSLTIRKEKVDSLTPKLRGPQGSGGELPDSEQPRTVLDIQVGQLRRVTTRDDEHVSAHGGLDVHEGHRPLVLVHDADLGFTCRK
jgi:hypothetical protein